MQTETIAAIASGMTQSGISIIRISGDDAVKVIDCIFRAKSGKKICEVKSHTIHYGIIQNDGNVVDEVMVLVMKKPNSYTREDTIEIDCHGGILVTKKILELVFMNGARLADPGEFTKRAFLNGRIDLSEAEAVMDVIRSSNEFALKCSMNQLRGSLFEKIMSLRKKLIYEIAFIESALDDPEHISIDGYPKKLNAVLEEVLGELNRMISSADDGKKLKEGINTVIVGKPNAGKSSLLNVLVGEEKAIVTDVEGTTRDAIEESIVLHGIQLNIIDTAGIRNTKDIVEKIGVERAKKYANEADLIIYVVDSSTKLDENDMEIISLLQNKKVIILLNKSDLKQETTEESIRSRLNKIIISVSAKEEKGISELEEEIKNMFFQGSLNIDHEITVTNVRHKKELMEAKESLMLVKKSIQEALPEDFFSIDLMKAYESLGNVIGESVNEDLVNEIFYKFCTGK